ncbi:MAG: hypothetical protein IJ368_01465 [Oscillospiraceae bacterium]|nr:hypothetical protein [Oscillospiraceae bacterium]
MILLSVSAVGCSDAGNSDTESYVIYSGNEKVNLLNGKSELEEQLGDKISDDTREDSPSSIVMASFYGEDADGFNYSYFHPVYDKENNNRKKFALHNIINVNTKKEDVEKILGSCMVMTDGDNTYYTEFYVNGKEIDYSLVDTSAFEDEENEYVKNSKSVKAYCVKQLENEEKGNFVAVHVSCYDGRDNDIGIDVFEK